MGVPTLTRARRDSYVPDVGENRAAAAAGQPALIATFQRPTVRMSHEYMRRRLDVLRSHQPLERDTAPALTPTEERETEGFLFGAAVQALWIGQADGAGGFEKLGDYALDDGTPIPTGAVLWALQDELDREGAAPLIADLQSALWDRATFDQGTLGHFGSRSGLPGSEAQTAGTAATVAVGA